MDTRCKRIRKYAFTDVKVYVRSEYLSLLLKQVNRCSSLMITVEEMKILHLNCAKMNDESFFQGHFDRYLLRQIIKFSP